MAFALSFFFSPFSLSSLDREISPRQMGCWGFITFPLGVLTVSTNTIGKKTESTNSKKLRHHSMSYWQISWDSSGLNLIVPPPYCLLGPNPHRPGTGRGRGPRCRSVLIRMVLPRRDKWPIISFCFIHCTSRNPQQESRPTPSTCLAPRDLKNNPHGWAPGSGFSAGGTVPDWQHWHPQSCLAGSGWSNHRSPEQVGRWVFSPAWIT